MLFSAKSVFFTLIGLFLTFLKTPLRLNGKFRNDDICRTSREKTAKTEAEKSECEILEFWACSA